MQSHLQIHLEGALHPKPIASVSISLEKTTVGRLFKGPEMPRLSLSRQATGSVQASVSQFFRDATLEVDRIKNQCKPRLTAVATATATCSTTITIAQRPNCWLRCAFEVKPTRMAVIISGETLLAIYISLDIAVFYSQIDDAGDFCLIGIISNRHPACVAVVL